MDNASNDESREILEQDLTGIRTYFSPTNVGFAAAVNHGLKHTTGEYVLLLNPDIIVLDNAIDQLVTFLDTHSKAGIVAGQLLNPNGTVQDSCFRFYTPLTILYRRTMLGALPFAKPHLRRIFMQDYDRTSPRRVDWVIGACMCVRRDAIQDVGMMDERFFMYFEDMDWCRRFWQKGWEVWYEPSARLAHYHKRESAQDRGMLALFNRTARWHIASGFKYFAKYRGFTAPARNADNAEQSV